MAMEDPINSSPERITNEWVLNSLKERLKKIESDLAEAKQIEQTDTTGEDDTEQREARDERDEMKDLLQTEKKLIEAKIGWITEHRDACIAPNCPNKVPTGRRKNLGVTCSEHMNDEGLFIKDLPFRS